MKQQDVIEGNRLIWSFMDGKWQPTEKAGQTGMIAYEPIHDTYDQCKKACDEINREKSGSPRKIEYAVPSPFKNIIDRELKYHFDWSYLLPVIADIKYSRRKQVVFWNELSSPSYLLYKKIETGLLNLSITQTWEAVVDLMKWRNKEPTKDENIETPVTLNEYIIPENELHKYVVLSDKPTATPQDITSNVWNRALDCVIYKIHSMPFTSTDLANNSSINAVELLHFISIIKKRKDE
jgi:hypothetical protein